MEPAVQLQAQKPEGFEEQIALIEAAVIRLVLAVAESDLALTAYAPILRTKLESVVGGRTRQKLEELERAETISN